MVRRGPGTRSLGARADDISSTSPEGDYRATLCSGSQAEIFLLIYIRLWSQNKTQGSCWGESPVCSASLTHSVGVGTVKNKTWVQSTYHNKQRIRDWKPCQWERRVLWFCPPLPWLSQNLIKVIHLGPCILPESVSGPYERWYCGVFKPSKSVYFSYIFQISLHSAPWHTCSCLNVLPASFGSSKVNMLALTLPRSFLPGCGWLPESQGLGSKGGCSYSRENKDCQLSSLSWSTGQCDSEGESRRFGDTAHHLVAWVNEASCQQKEGNHFLLRFMTRV